MNSIVQTINNQNQTRINYTDIDISEQNHHNHHHQQQILHVITYTKSDASILNAISVFDCIIIILGTFGNLTSFYLLTRKRLRPVSSMRYLASLTLIDSICLYGWYLSSVYRQLNGGHFKRLENINSFLCKFISYISFSSLQASSVLLCMLTIDRLLIIVSSQWRSKYANPKFASRIIIFLLIVILALNSIIPIRLGNKGVVQYKIKNFDESSTSFISFTEYSENKNDVIDDDYDEDSHELIDDDPHKYFQNKLNKNKILDKERKNFTMCHCYDDNDVILQIWNKLHLCIYSLIPFPILCILNLIVIRMTRDAAKSATQLGTNVKKFKNGQQFVTRLLLFLTISFLLTTLPCTIVYAFWHKAILKLRHGRVLLNLLNTLQFSRHSSNWIIYVYSSSFMREEFKKCIACTDSEYELAEAALANRPSIAFAILRDLQLDTSNNNENLNTDQYDFYELYNKQLGLYDQSSDNQYSNSRQSNYDNSEIDYNRNFALFKQKYSLRTNTAAEEQPSRHQ